MANFKIPDPSGPFEPEFDILTNQYELFPTQREALIEKFGEIGARMQLSWPKPATGQSECQICIEAHQVKK